MPSRLSMYANMRMKQKEALELSNLAVNVADQISPYSRLLLIKN